MDLKNARAELLKQHEERKKYQQQLLMYQKTVAERESVLRDKSRKNEDLRKKIKLEAEKNAPLSVEAKLTSAQAEMLNSKAKTLENQTLTAMNECIQDQLEVHKEAWNCVLEMRKLNENLNNGWEKHKDNCEKAEKLKERVRSLQLEVASAQGSLAAKEFYLRLKANNVNK